ncbi:hypothetical protein Tco_0431984 [Tanacetum coccineum]
MLAIFHDMVEKTMEVFMDDFSVFGNSFENCLSRLEKMLQRCEDTNLCLNWEKSHFMVKEGIVLGHKISKNGIEVDKAKIDVIAKLPHPTTVKGVRSFLGHAELLDVDVCIRKIPVLSLNHEQKHSAIGPFRSQVSFAKKDAKRVDCISCFSMGSPLQDLTLKFWTTKGSREPRRQDHCPIRKPYMIKFSTLEINDTLPLETLSMVTFHGDSSTPWFADIANYLAGTDISQKDEKPSKKQQNKARDGKVCEDEAQSKSNQIREEKAKRNIT